MGPHTLKPGPRPHMHAHKCMHACRYDVGARVHSDSWGSENTVYDLLAASLDRFTWNNKDFLPVVAAGA